MSNNNAKTHSWPYQPRHWSRDTDQLDWHHPCGRYVSSCPRPRWNAWKHSPGKDGTGKFPEDGLQLA